MLRWSNGLGHSPFKAEIQGSIPARSTMNIRLIRLMVHRTYTLLTDYGFMPILQP